MRVSSTPAAPPRGEPFRVVDEPLAVVAHRSHHGVPPDADDGGDRRDVGPVVTDESARLPTAPLGPGTPAPGRVR